MYCQTVKQEIEDEEEAKKFIPDIVMKSDWRDHSVLVKEATFKDESDEDRDDFDPFCCDYQEAEPDPPKPIVTKVELKIERYDAFAESDEIEMLMDEDEIEQYQYDDVHYETEILEEEFVENFPPIPKSEPKKETKPNASNTKTTVIIKQTEEKIVKPIKKRVYKAKVESDEDYDDADYGNHDNTEEKRSTKGPPIEKDLKYICVHEKCSQLPIFTSPFDFVHHMENVHFKTLSIKRLRMFVPWERLPGAFIRVEPEKLPKVIRCKKCQKVYSGAEGLKRHLEVNNCSSVKANFICKICYSEYRRADLRRLHMRLEHPAESDSILKCLICDEQCDSKQTIAEHYEIVHDNIFSCNLCSKDFKWAKGLLEHMRSQHMNFGLICDVCGKVLRCTKELTAHKEIHNVELTVKCTDCDLMFASTIKMKYHWENIHNPGEFICEICSKSYSTKAKLHKHRYEAHTEKNFRCHLCGKGFIRNGELNNHMLWHEGKWKPRRKARSIPSKEKIYQCEMCEMKTARAYNLKKHIKHVHMGEKRLPKNPQDFYCEICHKSFSEGRNYKKHMTRKSVHLVYKCDKCEQEILGLLNFRQHKKDHP